MTGECGDAAGSEGMGNVTREVVMVRAKEALARITQQPVDAVDLNVPFEKLGLSSIEGLTLLGDLELSLGVEIEPSEVFEFPTLSDFCEVLFERVASR